MSRGSAGSTTAWWDGRRITHPLVQSRGLHYGDGVFRTALLLNKEIIYLNKHINKLVEDVARLELTVDIPQVRRQLRLAVRGRASGVVKIMALRHSEIRGYPSSTNDTNIIIQLSDLNNVSVENWMRGVNVDISAVMLASQPRLAGVKHLNRLEQVLATRHWPQNVDERLMLDADAHVICGTRSNVFWVSAGALHTPALDRCGVRGVMREQVLETAVALAIPVQEVRAPLAALETADEAFVCNSVVGIWPLRACGARTWNAPGEFTRQLATTLAHPWQGQG